jgi:2-oxo-4-hydroxy-4-carboxy-5-ureidoimidazoline decarboxylase
MRNVLARWNAASQDAAASEILPCCGSRAWAQTMAAQRPFQDEAALISASGEVWRNLNESDWMEAFKSHPRIGESRTADSSAPRSSPRSSPRTWTWAMQEQKTVADAADAVKIALAEGNREYENKFGRIFIVCATGKSAAELLETLRDRLQNDAATELREATEQQRQIIQLRLRKWLQE